MNLPLNIDWQQILLHLFNFAILSGGLYFLLYKPVKDFMDKRKDYYEDMDKNAKAKLAEAENVKAEYEEKLADAENEIAKMKKESMIKASEDADRQLADARKEADRYMKKAREDMEREHDRMLEESKKEVADLALSATKKLLEQTANNPYENFLSSVDGGAADEGR